MRPRIILIVVVLPAPLCPIMAVASPSEYTTDTIHRMHVCFYKSLFKYFIKLIISNKYLPLQLIHLWFAHGLNDLFTNFLISRNSNISFCIAGSIFCFARNLSPTVLKYSGAPSICPAASKILADSSNFFLKVSVSERRRNHPPSGIIILLKQ